MSYAMQNSPQLAYNITFVLTEECNLRCRYCYEENKKKNVMTFEVAEKAIKYLATQKKRFDSVNWDFIGGEPLLEVGLIEKIILSIRKEFAGHPCMENEFYSSTTNGTLFNSLEVREFLSKYPAFQTGVSLDGIKEIHDYNRSNSFNAVMAGFAYWRKNFPAQSTKSTLNREALPRVFDSFKFLLSLGLRAIHMNCVYEDVWQPGDAEVFKEQLYKVANYLLDTGMYQCVVTNLFPISMSPDFLLHRAENKEEKRNWCGSGTCMVAIAPDGNFYPCVRFFTGTNKYSIGNVDSGIDYNKVMPFFFGCKQTSEECDKCEHREHCPHCFAWDYEKHGTIFKRATHVCDMVKAQFEVAKYYYSVHPFKQDGEIDKTLCKCEFKVGEDNVVI